MENQIKDISSKLEKIINSNKKAQAGKADYEKASSALYTTSLTWSTSIK